MIRFLSSKNRRLQEMYKAIVGWIKGKGYRYALVETQAGSRALVYLRESGIVVLVCGENKLKRGNVITMYGTLLERLEEIIDREAIVFELEAELEAEVMSTAALKRELSEDAKVGEGYYTTFFEIPWTANLAEAFAAKMDEADSEFDSNIFRLKYGDGEAVIQSNHFAEGFTRQERKDIIRRNRFDRQCANWISCEGYEIACLDDGAIGFWWKNEVKVELRLGAEGEILVHANVYLPVPLYDQSAALRQAEKLSQLELRKGVGIQIDYAEDFLSVQVEATLSLDSSMPFEEAMSESFVPVFKTFQSLHECIDPELLKTRSRIQEYLFASVQVQTECNMNEVYCIDKIDHVLNLKIVSPQQIELDSDLWAGEAAERLQEELRARCPYLNVSADEGFLLIDGMLSIPDESDLETVLAQQLEPLLQWREQVVPQIKMA